MQMDRADLRVPYIDQYADNRDRNWLDESVKSQQFKDPRTGLMHYKSYPYTVRDVTPDVVIVEFEKASREVQDACTKIIRSPLIRQGPADGGDRYATAIYDINQHGRIVNARLDKNDQRGTGAIKGATRRGVDLTRFEPPVHQGQRLYCRNVKDRLHWFTGPFSIEAYVVRSRANYSQELKW